ncbi:MAG TPA: LysR family transcriptional regulator, partial [Burkholderiaceae bacterium]
MSIDLKQLKYFLAVAEEKSFSRAAERLHISQPPLSQQIMKLEAELGVRLFARTTRHLELTTGGKAFVMEAEAVLGRVAMAVDTVRQIDRGEMGRLRVGVVSTAMWSPIPSLLEAFHTSYPKVTWTLHESGPSAQYEALMGKQIDVGFWRAPAFEQAQLAQDGLQQDLYFRENVCVAINEHHPLAQRDEVALADLTGEPMLSLTLEKSSFARYLVQCCVEAGFQPNVTQEASEPQTLLAMVGARLGVALLPETIARIAWPGVVFLPISDKAPSADLFITYTAVDDAPVVRA